MPTYRYIKDLLLEEIRRTNGCISFAQIAPKVIRHFPEKEASWTEPSNWIQWTREFINRTYAGSLTAEEARNLERYR